MDYKVSFKSISPFISELRSVTIFGAICHVINDKYGESILHEVFNNQGSLVVSDVLVDIDISSIYKSCNTDIREKLTKWVLNNPYTNIMEEHNIIDRQLGMSNHRWDNSAKVTSDTLVCYVKSDLFDKDDIVRIFTDLFLRGIGRGRNTGHGRFKLLDVKEIQLDKLANLSNSNGYITLSDYIPNEKDSTFGTFSCRMVKGITTNGDKRKPLYVLNRGAEFIGKSNGVVGRLQYDEATNTYTCGRSITLPIRIEQE